MAKSNIHLPDDGSKDGDFELRSGDNTGGNVGELGNNKGAEDFVKENKCDLEDRRIFHNISQDGEHAVEEERSGNSNGVGIHGDCDRKLVEEDWNQDTSTSACKAQGNKLVGRRISWLKVAKDLASMQESVTKHAHVFLEGTQWNASR